MPKHGSARRRLRRPSPAMAVALVALFLSAGGVSYAAVTLPAHSVGAAQLKTFAVTNPKLHNNSVGSRKIMPGAVGFYRVNRREVQLRLKNGCATGQAINNVDMNGNVTCAQAASETSSAPAAAVAVNSSTVPATMSSLSLPAGAAYTVQADPYLTITPNKDSSTPAEHVVVTCGLTAGTTLAQRNATFDLPAANANPQVQNASIPLFVALPTTTADAPTTVKCIVTVTDTSTGHVSTLPPTVTAQGQIYATALASAGVPTPTTTVTTTPAPTTTTTPAP